MVGLQVLLWQVKVVEMLFLPAEIKQYVVVQFTVIDL